MDGAADVLARELLCELDPFRSGDPFQISAACGFAIVGCGGTRDVHVDGRSIFVPVGMRRERAGFGVLRVLAGAALDRCPESLASTRLAACLLLPREEFERSLDVHGTHVVSLKERWPHASYEAIARRIVELRGGGLVLIDSGPVQRRRTIGSLGRVTARVIVSDRSHRRAIVIAS